MGLFSFFKQNRPQSIPTIVPEVLEQQKALPEIPKEIFIEDKEPGDIQTVLSSLNKEVNGINTIYSFLQEDYETRGYSDALINPDDSNKLDGIKLIKLDLRILIERVIDYYDKRTRDLDFHISSRGRIGLVDLVEQLQSEKEKALSDVQRTEEIKSSIEPGSGMVERLILSYKKGFTRGMFAITQSKILK